MLGLQGRFRQAVGLILLAAAWLAACAAPPREPGASPRPSSVAVGERPNIIIILADDLGYGEVGVQGGPATPHLDRLAAEGARFTDFYANHPVCAPSRAALMAGRYQQKIGFENNPGTARNSDESFGMDVASPTLAQRLKAEGYATGMVGKWHLGISPDRVPTARGFDMFYGFLGGAMAYTPDGATGAKSLLRGVEPAPMPAHTTEAFADEAAAFITANRDRPFFLYVSFNAVHAPMQTTSGYLARFANEPDAKRRAFLGMLAAMDDAVGRIIATVDGQGLRERTLIMFSSDNGGPTWQTTASNAPLNGVKALLLEGGVRVPTFFRQPGTIPAGQVIPSVAMEFDLTATALAAAGAARDDRIDGVDLAPILTGRSRKDAHERLFWRSGPQGAMREGKWKYLKVGADEYLFDLARDMGERTNLAAGETDRVRRMGTAWAQWSQSVSNPEWRATEAAMQTGGRVEAMQELVAAYVAGREVDPRPLLYGGGPE